MLKVSPSAYYDWKAGRSTKRIEREARIKAKVQEVWEESRYTYGSPRVWQAIKDAEDNYPVSENVLNRDFSVSP
ncbi:MAG: IS3 family transposase [Bacteroidota bacterium]